MKSLSLSASRIPLTMVLLTLVLLTLITGPTAALAIDQAATADHTPPSYDMKPQSLLDLETMQKKFVDLANALPADKLNWRPSPDSRSFAEVFLHVAGANYNLYKLVGTPPPTGLDLKNIEKSTTDKAKVIATLKDSYAHAKKAITAMPDADLDKSMDWFGGKITERGILLFVVRHGAEHLGQSIAYARFIGVVPPWAEDARKASAKGKD